MPRPGQAAFLVHVLTASGAALALLSLHAAVQGRWSMMFLWLGLALIVDAIDGPLARRLDVAKVLPRWSGETLDLVVDFVTYVFVPAYAIAAGGLLPERLGLCAGIVIVVTGAIYFADRRMKTPDNYFRGFPALWNLAAFYLLLLRPPSLVTGAIVLALAVLTFVPFPFIHPLRVGRFHNFNIALLVVWAGLGLIALIRDMAPGPIVTTGLCVIAAYVLGAGLFRRSAPTEPTSQ